MTAAEIGLGLQSDKRAGDYARLARRAEEHGFDVLSVFGDLMYQPPIFPLLEMAAATERVRLGAACLNPYSTAPYEIAGSSPPSTWPRTAAPTWDWRAAPGSARWASPSPGR
ncbi:hypothetical protein GCM10018952_09970 [Streptosporangium vulgare]